MKIEIIEVAEADNRDLNVRVAGSGHSLAIFDDVFFGDAFGTGLEAGPETVRREPNRR